MIGGKYRIVRELGKGGEGTVYLTEHVLTGTLRAVKVSGRNFGARSMHELDMMRRVRHASLPVIIDVLAEGASVCLVMEYVKGKPLSEFAGKNGKPGAEFFYCVAEQLLDALEYLHTGQLPMLHLDVKPSNIVVQEDGHLVLLDFGTAMPLGEKEGDYECYGTAGFAAPEQWTEHAHLDERTDLYGFAATLYFLLHGEKFRRQAPGRRGQAGAYMGGGWQAQAERWLLPCLEEDPKRRPSCAADVRRELVRMRRRRTRRRAGRQLLLSTALLCGVLVLAWGEFGKLSSGADPPQYGELLEKAELSGLSRSEEYYREAILAFPDKLETYRKVVDRISGDFVFTLEEEELLQSLLDLSPPFGDSSVLESLEDDRTAFGELAYRIGIAYWYFYEGSGGRSAATGWFRKAAQAGEKSGVPWARAAGIYGEIGGYYEKLGKRDLMGGTAVEAVRYWEDLGALYEAEIEEGEEELEIVKRDVMEERLNLLIFSAGSLRQAGISPEELFEAIRRMEAQGAEQLIPGRSGEAREAVQRAYREVGR